MADEDIGLSRGEDILSKLNNVINKLQQSASNGPDDPINKLAGQFKKLLEQFQTLDEKGKKEMGVNILKQVSGKVSEYQKAQLFNYQIIIFIVCVTFIFLLLGIFTTIFI